LNKISNNLTTRSHVFAVYLTIGFFEVVDPTTNPPTLGAELGKDQGLNLRHHAFAVVDASAITILANSGRSTSGSVTGTSPYGTVVTPAALSGGTAPNTWVIQPGSVVTVDPGTNQETVVVKLVDMTSGTFVADFKKTHSAGPFQIFIAEQGNPGPQPQFVPKDNSAVVPYYVVID